MTIESTRVPVEWPFSRSYERKEKLHSGVTQHQVLSCVRDAMKRTGPHEQGVRHSDSRRPGSARSPATPGSSIKWQSQRTEAQTFEPRRNTFVAAETEPNGINFFERMTDKLEKVTGIDIDGDGDVGMPGHDNKAGALRAVGSKANRSRTPASARSRCPATLMSASDRLEELASPKIVYQYSASRAVRSARSSATSSRSSRQWPPSPGRSLLNPGGISPRNGLYSPGVSSSPQKGFDDGTRRPRGHDGLYGAPASVIRKHVRANIELHRERNKTAHWKHAMSASAANEVDEFQSASSFWLWPTRFAEWLGPKSRGIVGWREEPRNLDNRAQFRQYIGLDRIDRHKQAVEDHKRDKQKRQRCEACLERIKAIALQLLLAIAIVAPLAWLSMWWWSSYIDPKPPTPPMPPMPPTPPPSPPSPPSSLMLLEHALERMPAWLWVCGITFSGGFIAVIRTCGHQEATEFGRNQQQRPSSSSRYARLRDSPGRSPISA